MDSMNQSCFESYSAVSSFQEDSRMYYEYKPLHHATDVVLLLIPTSPLVLHRRDYIEQLE